MDLGDLDGVVVAPGNHKVLFENDDVRVLETTIAVGETTPLHTHFAPTVMYVISGSHFRRRDEGGMILVDTRATPGFILPKVLFSSGLPSHTLENTGDDLLIVIGVELKHARRAGDAPVP
ncbi:MAG: cytoplasmic protein [Chloroflexi bacterium]|nr:cytoplasmic protein [Chloroflexota bacterium]